MKRAILHIAAAAFLLFLGIPQPIQAASQSVTYKVSVILPEHVQEAAPLSQAAFVSADAASSPAVSEVVTETRQRDNQLVLIQSFVLK